MGALVADLPPPLCPRPAAASSTAPWNPWLHRDSVSLVSALPQGLTGDRNLRTDEQNGDTQ